MFYALNKNVYLVKGSVRSCIYDFNLSKLYSVNSSLSQKLELVNQGKIKLGFVDRELNDIFEQLNKIGILVLSETPSSHDISEIKAPEYGCGFAWIEITNKCNLKCIHCYNESNTFCDSVMSLQDYKMVIDKLLDLGVRRIQIIGGEPFFDKKILKKMLDYTVGKFRFIEIFTNGTLISTEWFDFFKKNDIHVALSLYSYDEKIHDKVTKSIGSWAKTNNTIEALKKHGIPYRVCNVLMKDVELGNRTTNLYKLSNEKDIVRMSGRASFSLLSDDLIRKKLITKKTFQTPLKKEFCSTLVSGHNCFKNKIYISANMEVYPCVMERRIKHGVINKESGIILDDTIRNFNKDKIKECNRCEYRYACFDCRPNSLAGDIKEKPWYCTYNPLEGEWENEEKFIEKLKKKWDD